MHRVLGNKTFLSHRLSCHGTSTCWKQYAFYYSFERSYEQINSK